MQFVSLKRKEKKRKGHKPWMVNVGIKKGHGNALYN